MDTEDIEVAIPVPFGSGEPGGSDWVIAPPAVVVSEQAMKPVAVAATVWAAAEASSRAIGNAWQVDCMGHAFIRRANGLYP